MDTAVGGYGADLCAMGWNPCTKAERHECAFSFAFDSRFLDPLYLLFYFSGGGDMPSWSMFHKS